MNKTAIEWVKNPDGTQGYTSNPVRGKCPVGCSYCYVKPLRKRWGWHKDIRFYPEELKTIQFRKKPAGIFLGSTIELFHEKTLKYMPTIMNTIETCPQHRFYTLTKQPQNLKKFSPFPDNCWVGITAPSMSLQGDVDYTFQNIQASVKFVSFEPLLDYSPIDFRYVNWVIIGGCTGTMRDLLPLHHKTGLAMAELNNRRWVLLPQPDWVKAIEDIAKRERIPIFEKDNLKPLLQRELIQEMPE